MEKTKIKIKRKETAGLSDIKVGGYLVASGAVDEKGAVTAKRLFVIPEKPKTVGPKESTKSATPSSTQ